MTTKLVVLIDDNGVPHRINGVAEEGIGIEDEAGNQYPAGLDKHGACFACSVEDDMTIDANNAKGILDPFWRCGKLYDLDEIYRLCKPLK